MQDGMRNSILAPFRHPDSLPASLARDRINWPHAIFTGFQVRQARRREYELSVNQAGFGPDPGGRSWKTIHFALEVSSMLSFRGSF